MPKEFGEWLGDQPQLDFDDPGKWVRPKKKPEPQLLSLKDAGFRLSYNRGEWHRTCAYCGERKIFIRELLEQEYLAYCLKNKIDPAMCSLCHDLRK